MRLAIYYDIVTGRNDGNPLYVWNSLKKRQEKGLLEIDHLAPAENINLFGKYDANILVDWGEDGLRDMGLIPYEMVEIPHPNIYWASDTHLGFDFRLETAKKFDHVFVAQKQAVIDFEKAGVKAEWLPHAVEPQAYPKFDYANKDTDVCFVGHINSPNRAEFLDRMFAEFPNFFFGQRRFEEAAQKYCKSKIVLNIAMKEDLNMRVFETLGTGSFLLTDYVPYIEELFEDGKHLVLYRSIEEAIDKAKYYLAHDSEREKIAQAGYEEAMKNHTIDKRVDRILDKIDLFKKVVS
jgi:spore maturation protein CgeB